MISKKPILLIRVALLFILLLGGCSKSEEKFSLRNQEVAIYEANKEAANSRLASIRYHAYDTDISLERFKIVHISDAHVSAERSSENHYASPKNLQETIKFANQPEIGINAIVNTGDNISSHEKKDAFSHMQSFFSHLFKDNSIPTISCFGNHDSNMFQHNTQTYLNKTELSNFLYSRTSNNLKYSINQNYNYIDIPNPMGGSVRIIALDMLDQQGTQYNTFAKAIYSQQQIDWLVSKALSENLTNNHSIIILNHFPFQQPYQGGSYLCDAEYIHPWYMIPEIIEAYRTKTRISKTYPNQQIPDEPLVVDYDFANSPGEFICYMGGHAHVTADFSISNLENSSSGLAPQRMLLCTNMSPSEVGTVYNKVTRTANTLSSNSFCIYAIDTIEKKIYITYFGAYIPEGTTDYPAIKTLNYL